MMFRAMMAVLVSSMMAGCDLTSTVEPDALAFYEFDDHVGGQYGIGEDLIYVGVFEIVNNEPSIKSLFDAHAVELVIGSDLFDCVHKFVGSEVSAVGEYAGPDQAVTVSSMFSNGQSCEE
jgi:hypothetical protein